MAAPSGSARKGGSEWGHKAAGLAAEGGRPLVRIQSLGPKKWVVFLGRPVFYALQDQRPLEMATPSGSARKGGSEWGHKAAGLAAEGGRPLVRIQSLGPRNGSSFWDGPFLLYTAGPETYYRVGSLGGLFAAAAERHGA